MGWKVKKTNYKMTDEEINRVIAEICGWKILEKKDEDFGYCFRVWVDPFGQEVDAPPNFCGDLNAMHEAENILTEKQKRTFAFMLAQVLDTSPTVDLGDQFLNIHATARQRAKAFLRTMGKWEEAK